MTNPNFKPGVGRLVTDRLDFQKHVDGYGFRHKATTIDLSPAVSVPGQGTQTTVQSALEKISLVIESSGTVVVDASTVDKGIVKLAGDIGGTATNVKVTKIQGFPVVTTPPTTNQALTWNGSAWNPSTISNFVASGDLDGSSTSQTVVGLRGRNVDSSAPSTNQFLGWNGSSWIPTTAPAGATNSVQLSNGSGGFSANTSLGLSSGGSLKINLTGSTLEMAVPIGGYSTTSQSFKMTMASVNATTGSGAYTPTSSQIACPFWVITNASTDGYINMPNQSQSMYFIINDTGSTCYFRAATSGGPDCSFTVGQKGVIYHTGTVYRTLLVQ